MSPGSSGCIEERSLGCSGPSVRFFYCFGQTFSLARWSKEPARRLQEFKILTHFWTRRGVKPGKGLLEGGANSFTAERGREHTAKKGDRGLGMDMSPEEWTWDRFFHNVLDWSWFLITIL